MSDALPIGSDGLHCTLLLTRDPYKSHTGRGLVLRTGIEALQKLGIKITIVCFANTEIRAEGIKAYSFGSPSPRDILSALFSSVVRGYPVNERIYVNKKKMQRLVELVKKEGPDFIFADMIRMAPYAQATELPTIFDLDDLLSLRYRNAVLKKQPTGFGYLSTVIPQWIGGIFQVLNLKFLSREAKLLQPRELYYVNQFKCTSLVSRKEADLYFEKHNKKLHTLPMKMAVDEIEFKEDWKNRALFVGTLNYGPNLQAFEFLATEVVPLVRARAGFENFTLYVVGKKPEEYSPPAGEGFEFLGFVDELANAYAECDVVLAPSFLPGGIKTKVIEAVGYGKPTVINNDAACGLSGIESIAWLAETPLEWADRIVAMSVNREAVKNRSRDGVTYVRDRFGERAILDAWSSAIESLSIGKALEPSKSTGAD